MTLGITSDGWRCGSAAASNCGSFAKSMDAPLRSEMWKNDATWPVREGGYVKEVGSNWSLDIDIGITRRTMRVGTERRSGIRVGQDIRPRSNPLVYRRLVASGLPSVPAATRASPVSLPCSSPRPFPPCTPPTPSCSSTAEPGRASAPPLSPRFLVAKAQSARRAYGDRRCESAMSYRSDDRLRSGLDYAGQRCRSAQGMISFNRFENARTSEYLSDGLDVDRSPSRNQVPQRVYPPAQQMSAHHQEDGWLPVKRRGSCMTDVSDSSESTPPTPPPVSIDPPKVRTDLVKWCFRFRREAVESRLLLLDRSMLGEEHRNQVYMQREEDAKDETEIGNLIALYKRLGLKGLPQIGHPAALETWPSWEGGFSRTSEIVNALEVLNFYRWLCRVPRLKLDSFRQDLADLVLQVLTKRDPRVHMQQEGVACLERFFEGLPKYVTGKGGRTIVVSHIPAAPAAIRALFTGLANGASSNIRVGADLPSLLAGEWRAQSHLPDCSNAGLRDYLPLLQLGHSLQDEPIGDVSVDLESLPSYWIGIKPCGAQTGNVCEKRKGLESQVLQSCPQQPGVTDQKRLSPAWGDIRGIVAFRRSALDPRLRNTGLLRRGCRTCLWVDTQIDDEPELIPEDEQPSLSMSFLDREAVVDESSKGKASSQLRNLQRWREDIGRRITSGEFSVDAGNETRRSLKSVNTVNSKPENRIVVSGEAAVVHTPNTRSSLIATFATSDPEVIEQPVLNKFSAFERQSQDLMETANAIEQALGQHHAIQSGSDLGDDDSIPLMVCFPPPGIVPIEIVQEAQLFWTISLDHQRLTPTSTCKVQVFRVKIDIEKGIADRIDSRAVALANFVVDCTNVGTPFCVVFQLATDVQAGDQFEIVLDGLAGTRQYHDPVSELSYFVSFETFRPSVWDAGVLRRRARNLLRDQSAEHIWQDPFMFVPDLHHEDDTHSPVHVRSGRAKMERFSSSGRSEFSAKSPPTLGLVQHPNATGNGQQGTYTIEASFGNEVSQVMLVPSSVILKATLLVFVKSSAKWETLPNAVFMTYFREEALAQGSAGESDKMLPWEQAVRQTDSIQPAPPQRHRIVFRMMLPVVGRYELRLNWGLVPNEPTKCGSLTAAPTPHEHPLRILLSVGAKVPNFRPLVPSMFHSTVKRLGYPIKHLLAEHWGVTVIGPLRYRLRMGFVRFTVLVKQGRLALSETDAMIAGAQEVAKKQKDQSESPLWTSEVDIDDRKLGVLSRKTTAVSHASSEWDAGSTDPFNSLAATTPKSTSSKLQGMSNQACQLAREASAVGSKPEGRVKFKEDPTRVDVEIHSQSTDSDADVKGSLQEDQSSEKAEAAITEICLDEVQRRSNRQMKHLIRRGTNGKICIVAVVGSWRRVELLRRRPLEPPPPPSSTLDMAYIAGSAVSAAAAEVAVAKDTEVHEAILNITDEDQGQVVQLLAFQIGAADSADVWDATSLASGVSAPSECGSDATRQKRKTVRGSAKRQSVGGKRSRGHSTSSDKGRSCSQQGVSFGERLTIATLNGESRITQRVELGPPPHLGQLSTPARWTLAEFTVEGANILPYDEDEMEKPLPVPKDPIELIGFESKD